MNHIERETLLAIQGLARALESRGMDKSASVHAAVDTLRHMRKEAQDPWYKGLLDGAKNLGTQAYDAYQKATPAQLAMVGGGLGFGAGGLYDLLRSRERWEEGPSMGSFLRSGLMGAVPGAVAGGLYGSSSLSPHGAEEARKKRVEENTQKLREAEAPYKARREARQSEPAGASPGQVALGAAAAAPFAGVAAQRLSEAGSGLFAGSASGQAAASKAYQEAIARGATQRAALWQANRAGAAAAGGASPSMLANVGPSALAPYVTGAYQTAAPVMGLGGEENLAKTMQNISTGRQGLWEGLWNTPNVLMVEGARALDGQRGASSMAGWLADPNRRFFGENSLFSGGYTQSPTFRGKTPPPQPGSTSRHGANSFGGGVGGM